MFFGLEVRSKEKQSKPVTLENSVQLSQAVLLPQGAKKDPVCLVVDYDNKEFVLCVLDPSKSWQSPLNLIFEGGSQVRFFLRGAGTVHLTGYEITDDLDDISMSMSEDEEITSESDCEPNQKMIMAKKSPKAITNGHKSPNKSKDSIKQDGNQQNDDDDDDDDDDESDVDFFEDSESDDEEDDDDDGEEDSDDDNEQDTDSDDDGDGKRAKGRYDKIRRLDVDQDLMSDDDDDSDYAY